MRNGPVQNLGAMMMMSSNVNEMRILCFSSPRLTGTVSNLYVDGEARRVARQAKLLKWEIFV